MQRMWKMRLFFALIFFIACIYFLYPSMVYFSLSSNELKDVRQNKNAFIKHLPKWINSSHIVPGLDLQGGSRIVLNVDITRIISNKIIQSKDCLKQYANKNNIQYESIKHINKNKDIEQIEISTKSHHNIELFEKQIYKRFKDLTIVSNNRNKLKLVLNLKYIKKLKQDIVNQTIYIIRNRIDKIGITDPIIARQGENQIQIQLPGYDNTTQAKKLIGRTAQLYFQICNDDNKFLTKLKNLPVGTIIQKSFYSRPNSAPGTDIYLKLEKNKLSEVKNYLSNKIDKNLVIKYGALADDSKYLRTYTLFKKIEISGEDLIDARVSMFSKNMENPSVAIKFSPNGARIFDELTKNSIGKRIAIVLEDEVNSAPVINQRIENGNASISIGGAFSRKKMEKEAKDLSLILKAGALPAPITFSEERSVGASLGSDSIKSGKQAFLIGGILISLFMLIYYKNSGIIAILGLFFNIITVLAVLSNLGATITLPGIAGLLLTIGMAVDANIIINERIKEELKLGKMPYTAIETGYKAAFSAVLDANITTFIAGIVLWQFGSGPIKNFATMIIIGTISSVISAVFITRIFFDILISKKSSTISI